MQITNLKQFHTNKAFLPYDVYERHRQVGALIKNNQSVLDVGGELNHLSQFCKSAKIVVANLTGGDIIISKDNLPFKNNSFNVVCAIDVLEHIPKNGRLAFTKNLTRVAKDKIIVSFPIGTGEHAKYEKEIANWLDTKQIDITYLKEHIELGLPTPSEIADITQDLKSNVFYSGSINLNRYLFKLHLFDPNIKFIRKPVYFLKLFFNFLTNPIFYKFLTNKKLGNNVNRAYIIINKNQKL